MPVTFVIDTGAARSCLHPLDAINALGIDAATLAQTDNWAQTVTHQGVGGANTYFREAAYDGLRHDDGQWQPMAGAIDIAQARPENERLPSLRGWDLLQHFRLTFDWSARLITLQ